MNNQAQPGSGAMFDGIAERYDLLNRLMSFGLDNRWRRLLVEALNTNGDGAVLDVATGTADIAVAVARHYPHTSVVGLDPSEGMLEVGRGKLTRLGLDARIRLVAGDAQAMPFADSTFSGSCIAFGIRNVPDRLQGLREMARVTETGKRVVILELCEPPQTLMGALARVHVHHVVPFMGACLSGSSEYRYLQRSIAAFPPPEDFIALMQQAGLRDVTCTPMTFGAANLYVGLAT